MLKTHVASVCFKCFRCSRGMLQVFKINIVKVDRDVVYVAMDNGCIRMMQRSVPNVSSVFSDVLLQVCLSRCCICFMHMLQVFYRDNVYVCNDFQVFL
jgi:hypothetical protein